MAHLAFVALERVSGNDLVVLVESRVDSIRDELAALGIVLKDSREGTTWVVDKG